LGLVWRFATERNMTAASRPGKRGRKAVSVPDPPWARL